MPNEIENLEQSHVKFNRVDKEVTWAICIIVVIVVYIILKVVL